MKTSKSPFELEWEEETSEQRKMRLLQEKAERMRKRREQRVLFRHGKWTVFQLDAYSIVVTNGDIMDSRKFTYWTNTETAFRFMYGKAADDALKAEAGNWLAAFQKLREELMAEVQAFFHSEFVFSDSLEAPDALITDEEG